MPMMDAPVIATCKNCETPIILVDESGPHSSWRHILGVHERNRCLDPQPIGGYKCCGRCKEHCSVPQPTVTDDVWPGTPC